MTTNLARTNPGQRQYHERFETPPVPDAALIEGLTALKSILDGDDIETLNSQLSGQEPEVQRLIAAHWFDLLDLRLRRDSAIDRQNGNLGTQVWVECKIAEIDLKTAEIVRQIEELIVDDASATVARSPIGDSHLSPEAEKALVASRARRTRSDGGPMLSKEEAEAEVERVTAIRLSYYRPEDIA